MEYVALAIFQVVYSLLWHIKEIKYIDRYQYIILHSANIDSLYIVCNIFC